MGENSTLGRILCQKNIQNVGVLGLTRFSVNCILKCDFQMKLHLLSIQMNDPALHLTLYLLDFFADFDMLRTRVKTKQTYIPAQLRPSPSNPFKHRHTYDPSVLVHKAFGSHSFLSSLAHSSISEKKQGISTLETHNLSRRMNSASQYSFSVKIKMHHLSEKPAQRFV